LYSNQHRVPRSARDEFRQPVPQRSYCGFQGIMEARVNETERLQAAFLAAERELRLARSELSEAQAEGSVFAPLDGLRDRVAIALDAYALAKRRRDEGSSDAS
jgi:hypothetical protein